MAHVDVSIAKGGIGRERIVQMLQAGFDRGGPRPIIAFGSTLSASTNSSGVGSLSNNPCCTVSVCPL